MQAIILAAGMGKRLKNLTADATKCMVKVNGVTLIERALQNLEKANLERIIIVVGYQSQKLIEFVDSLHCTTPILYVENPVYSTTNNIYSLFLAREYLLESDTILLESDLIFEEDVLLTLLANPHPNLALVAKYESWMDGTVVTLDEDLNITDFLSKSQFDFTNIAHYYKTVNIYKFSKEFSTSHYVPFLEAYCKALGNNEYYEQVLKVISLLDEPGIKACVLGDERWYEIDDIQDLDIAESLFTNSASERLESMFKRYGGYWRYPKLIDFCYLVNPHYPPKRLIQEITANFDRLIADYPSGQEVNALLAAKYFGVEPVSIVVGNGAAELIKSLAGFLDDPIGIILPTFAEYPNRFTSYQTVEYQTSSLDYSYTASDIMDYFDNRNISSLILINPDNPSGNLLDRDELEKLLGWAHQKQISLVVDESFIDFATDGNRHTLLNQKTIDENPNLIVVKSISKSFGVPGLRLGVLVSANKQLLNHMKQDVSIWNINSFAEFFLQIFEKYRDDYEEALRRFKRIRSDFFDSLQTIPFLRPIPSEANYIMCEILSPHSARNVTEQLLSQFNILIKDLSDKNGVQGQCIRIAVKLPEDNASIIFALKTLLSTRSHTHA